MNLVLIRHGETEHNRQNILQGRTDIPLNETGREQAEKLADRVSEEFDYDRVCSSDLSRASETASIIAEAMDSEHVEFEEFRERNFGVLEGERKSRRREMIDHPDELDMLKPEDGEHLKDLRQRALGKIRQELETRDNLLIVAHGWVNRAVITGLLESGEGHAHQLKQGNTCINVLERDEFRGWQLKRLNDTAHL
ncbi:MAG: histidine phosphatase family protein [Candidatus Nanosalina sp.]